MWFMVDLDVLVGMLWIFPGAQLSYSNAYSRYDESTSSLKVDATKLNKLKKSATNKKVIIQLFKVYSRDTSPK